MNKNGPGSGSGTLSKIEEIGLEMQKPRLTESVRLAETEVSRKRKKAGSSRKAKGKT
jgi:hypothetical protein